MNSPGVYVCSIMRKLTQQVMKTRLKTYELTSAVTKGSLNLKEFCFTAWLKRHSVQLKLIKVLETLNSFWNDTVGENQQDFVYFICSYCY